jgi:hypothetical protein
MKALLCGVDAASAAPLTWILRELAASAAGASASSERTRRASSRHIEDEHAAGKGIEVTIAGVLIHIDFRTCRGVQWPVNTASRPHPALERRCGLLK